MTSSISNIEANKIPYLLSKSRAQKYKTLYTIEPVSANNLDKLNKNRIDINHILSTKLVKYFFKAQHISLTK